MLSPFSGPFKPDSVGPLKDFILLQHAHPRRLEPCGCVGDPGKTPGAYFLFTPHRGVDIDINRVEEGLREKIVGAMLDACPTIRQG